MEGSPISRRLEIDYDPATVDAEAIRREVSDLGYRVLAPSTSGESSIKIWSSRRALRGRVLDMHVLMLLAVIGAIAIGEYMEEAAIAFLFSVAELLEGFASERAEASVRSLMEMSPDVARVRREGVEVTMRAAEVGAVDLVVVRPGERIPVDGHVVEGHSAVNEAPITGEAMPRPTLRWKRRTSPSWAMTWSGCRISTVWPNAVDG